MPRILAVDPNAPDPAVIAVAAAVLKRGGLVAFPTETVYGLGARGLHVAEVAKIFAAKRRPAGHPVILHVDREEMARSLSASWSDAASTLARRFWPGPLTLVVPRAAHVPPEVSGGLGTVGLRAPSHPVALALIRAVGEPLAAPSANAHTHISPTTAQHVASSLGDRIDLILDGGACTHGIESTVVAVEEPLRVLRPGAISLAQLRALDPAVVDGTSTIEGDAARAAPGMAKKHYAPLLSEVRLAARGDVSAFDGQALMSEVAKAPRPGRLAIAAIVVTEAMREAAAAQPVHPIVVLPDDPVGYAHALYSALYQIDALRPDLLFIEAPPEGDPAWSAVADRLRRAASKG